MSTPNDQVVRRGFALQNQMFPYPDGDITIQAKPGRGTPVAVIRLDDREKLVEWLTEHLKEDGYSTSSVDKQANRIADALLAK